MRQRTFHPPSSPLFHSTKSRQDIEVGVNAVRSKVSLATFFLFVPMKNFAKGRNPSRHKVMGLRVFAIVIWPNYFIQRRLWCRQIGGQIDSNITNTTTHLLYNSKPIKTTLSLQSCLPKSNFSKWLKLPFFIPFLCWQFIHFLRGTTSTPPTYL